MVIFKIRIFLKFFMYHVLFFYFGFLSLLVILPIDNLALANNMSFWVTTKNKLHLYVQGYQWAVNFIILLLLLEKQFNLFGGRVPTKNIFIEQMIFYNIFVVIRAFIIAVRYGFISNLRLKILNAESKEYQYIGQDLLVPNWYNMHPKGLRIEIEGAIYRNQVEFNTFKFAFIEKLP